MQSLIETEKDWFVKLRKGDERALEYFFNTYYKYLVVTAFRLLNDEHRAKDIVQDSFFDLWKKREQINISGAIKPYFRKAVVNKCIDEIRRKKKWTSEEDLALDEASPEISAQQQLEVNDLEAVIHRAIAGLPERCRIVFMLSRFEEKSHKEIAADLDISVKTIENQMTKALKTIRAAVDASGLRLWPVFLLASYTIKRIVNDLLML